MAASLSLAADLRSRSTRSGAELLAVMINASIVSTTITSLASGGSAFPLIAKTR